MRNHKGWSKSISLKNINNWTLKLQMALNMKILKKNYINCDPPLPPHTSFFIHTSSSQFLVPQKKTFSNFLYHTKHVSKRLDPKNAYIFFEISSIIFHERGEGGKYIYFFNENFPYEMRTSWAAIRHWVAKQTHIL